MSGPDTSDYDLLTEHLSYPPVVCPLSSPLLRSQQQTPLTSLPLKSLLDDIINTVNVLADRALDSVERLLLSIPPRDLGFAPPPPPLTKDDDDADPPSSAEDAARLEIENGTHQLETLLNASIDKNFDIFELYAMRYILTVAPEDRPHMRLAHYQDLDFAAAAAAADRRDAPDPQSVAALRRRLHASLRLQVRLEEERARNDALLRKLSAALGLPTDSSGEVKGEPGAARQSPPFAFMLETAGLQQGGADKPVSTTAQFTLSQLQALRSLSTSLRTILPDLATTTAADSSSSQQGDAGNGGSSSTAQPAPSWRRERGEYVEAASRKYLESAAGLELGPQGEVRDGEWQGDGRQLSRGEVEGLEKVVAILGSERKGGAPADAGTADEAMDES